ncbi:MAG: universal stress protein [Sphingomonas sp.]|jgi:nucleotide-binding universal stress UspA family protein|uniref:universal stress protein n=1 Tax=Sphingomonas sp. TaxID=28214 RepID=UPI00356668AD
MKNILLLAHDDHGQEARLKAGLDVTRAVGGHLTCLDVIIMPELMSDFVSMGGGALALADEERSELRNRVQIRDRLVREGVPFDWVEKTGDLADCIRATARLTDLVVVNRQLDSALFPNTLDLVGRLVVEEKLPVLAVPERATGFRSNGRALVAWDGSPSAEAALRAAMPLLQCASKVTLFHIDDGSIAIPVEEAESYLTRYGITPVIRREKALTARPGTILLAEVTKSEADYVVMGGYGHARLLEQVFGGTTQRMLTESPVPVLLAHCR